MAVRAAMVGVAVVTTLDRAAARLARTRKGWDAVTIGPPDRDELDRSC